MAAATTSTNRLMAGLVLALAIAGCADLPQRLSPAPAAPVAGLEATPLAQIIERSAPPTAQAQTGLRLLASGEHAFDARVGLARHATRTLDAQYYLLASDAAGRQFLRELRDAAQRGVRVRLLVDDLHSADVEALLVGLAAHEHVEVRLFNPLPVRTGSPITRLLLSANDFGQLNRRMHNKLFVADGQAAITGGRNVADEYFMRSGAANFVDVDVLAVGPAVRELAEAFERYWSSAYAYPIEQLVDRPAEREAAMRSFDGRVSNDPPAPVPTQDVLGRSAVSQQLAAGQLELVFADVQVLVDPPEKVAMASPTLDDSALGQGLARLRQARSEVAIVSPYFIPGARGMAMIREATDAQVRVIVLTNSMAATDEPMVHRAYARYRRAMLEMGVQIHELSPSLSRKSGLFGDFRSSDGRLHAKVAVADRRWVLLGSMNMDGRSARANTELGLLIDSVALAQELRSLLHRANGSSSWALRTTGGGIEWITHDGSREVVLHEEPGAALGQHIRLGLLSLFVDEDLL